MTKLRSLLILLAATASPASAALAQAGGRLIDEGTFVITRQGAPSQTESFRIVRLDDATIRATGQLTSGTTRTSSTLVTDTLGTPVEYRLEVRENGALTTSIAAVARSGRLSARTTLQHGDESMREFPITRGSCLILEDELLHQAYFAGLARRGGAFQVISPRSAKSRSATLTAHGLEPVTVGGRSVTATRYSLDNGTGRRDFWVDSAGRLLRVELPDAGIRATREELPR
jgi:hypothetical protein